MLKDAGCKWIAVGHSDETIAQKVMQSLQARLKVFVCIGETWHERETDQTEAVLCNYRWRHLT